MCCRQGKVATGPRGEEWAGKGGRSELEQAARGGGGARRWAKAAAGPGYEKEQKGSGFGLPERIRLERV
jgi:hypothetical protein